MDAIKEKITNFFSTVKTFISDNKKAVVVILSFIVFITILLIILISMLSKNDEEPIRKTSSAETQLSNEQNETGFKKISPDSLWLLEEPLKLPPIQFSREQREIWKPAELDYWYEAPDEQAMKELRQKNKEIIDNLLEDAP